MKIYYQNNNSLVSEYQISLSKEFLLSKLNPNIDSIFINHSFSDIEFETYLIQDKEIVKSPNEIVDIRESDVFINLDLISIFYIASNLLKSKERSYFDNHNRLDISRDIFEDNGLPYIDLLINYINSHFDKVERGRIRLSMDVDHVQYKNLSLLRLMNEWRKFNKYQIPLKQITKLLLNYSNSRLDHVLKYSQILKDKSISGDFFFMFCHLKTSFDSGYEIDKKIYKVMEELVDSGHRIGFHPSYYAFQDEEKFHDEYQRYITNFGKDFMIIRNHYLRNDYDNYWNLIDKYNFKEDHSIGMSTNCGFFSGISSGFSPINKKNKKFYNFKSFPLNYMDDYLFDNESYFNEFDNNVTKILLNGCDVSVLFHNSLFLHTNYFKKLCDSWLLK